jgi:hypothetical protein
MAEGRFRKLGLTGKQPAQSVITVFRIDLELVVSLQFCGDISKVTFLQ